MRDFLNAILEFIGAEDLTDEEYGSTQPLGDDFLSLENYNALKSVLEARESVTEMLSRLSMYYQAGQVDLGTTPANTPRSNIFIGGAL